MTYQRPSHLGTRAGAPLRWATSLALFLVASAHSAQGAGVVGTGTPESCTEAALNAGLAGGGVVTFNCGPDPVTITLTAEKVITAEAAQTTVDGGGFVTLSGGNTVRVFRVDKGAMLDVRNLTIADGYGVGGGISNAGTVTVTNSTLSHNRAGLTGGGIFNDGTLTVTNSTFSGNSAPDFGGGGGGIFNFDGTVTVANSTFSNNSASGDNGGSGGGIANGATLTVTNSTFLNNSAKGGGGGIFNGGTVTVTNSTFSGNSAAGGGGISNLAGLATLTNTIVANSTQGDNCSGTITDGGHNLDSDGTCGVGPATDPQLDPAGLADNGGPTQTIALQAGSPAIDAGDSEVCANPPVNAADQRGFLRPGTGYADCSIGAYEYGTPQNCTEAALDAALAGGGRVAFNCGPDPVTITLTHRKSISAATTVDGGALITLDGNHAVQVFSVAQGSTLSLENLTIAHAAGSGVGAVSNGGTLSVTNSTFSGNSSISMDASSAGAISNFGTLTVTNSTFSGNSGGLGGAIGSEDSFAVTVTNSTFSGNAAAGGGAIAYGFPPVAGGRMLTVTNCTFSGNSASEGGAIANGGALTVTNSTFSNNSIPLISDGGGAGIYNLGDVTVMDSTFSGNSASGVGGGIANRDLGTVTATNSTFSDNSAGAGGAISNTAGTLTVTNSTFSGNSAGGGGGSSISNSGTLTVINSTFSGNSAGGAGGGISNSGTLTVTNSTFSRNGGSRAGEAGGIYNDGLATLTNTIVASSSNGNCAGAITDGGHNLDSDGTCGVGPATDPQLDPAGLGNNGGPTQTIALQAGSPAINAGDSKVCANPLVSGRDQRGYVRPGVGHAQCSIGAYEADANPPSGACVGDCDGNGVVAINELILGVNIALAIQPVEACSPFTNAEGMVDIAQLITGVNNALGGCGSG